MEQEKHLKLSELSSKVNKTLDETFRNTSFWVLADVTNHVFKPDKNYHSFDLVEKDSQSHLLTAKFSAKAWSIGSNKLNEFEKITGQKFTNNINVLIRVTVDFHAVYGLQLNVIDIDVNYTIGTLERQRQAIIAKLLKENPDSIKLLGDNYVTFNKQLKLKIVIQKVAIISSATSAGYLDFKHTLENNQYAYKFQVDEYFAVIQGQNNVKQFVDKIIEVYESGVNYDALIIVRGGGSDTDFLLFDSYAISRAVARFPIPVIVGVGHQKNSSISDLMAHTSAKTPTKAAEFIIDHNRQFEEAILNFQRKVIIKAQQRFSGQFRSLSILNTSIVNNSRNLLGQHKNELIRNNQIIINNTKSIIFVHKSALLTLSSQLLNQPKMMIYNKKNDLKNICSNLKTFNAVYLKSQAGYLKHYVSVIKMMSPDNILKKGFAIIKSNGNITGNSNDISIGQEISIILSKEEIKATVNSKKIYGQSEFKIDL